MEKTAKIENFIGTYDNYIMDEECDKAIKLFEEQDRFHNTLNRKKFENSDSLRKKDTQFFAHAKNIDTWWTNLRTLIVNFEIAFNHYITTTGADAVFNHEPFHYTQLKIQKTLPGEGYHVWHTEHHVGFETEPRAFAYSIYLNDVEDGGETEFLNQSIRVKPKKGRIAIWPAGFPYVHRGNPPLKGEKYILTSWMLLRSV